MKQTSVFLSLVCATLSVLASGVFTSLYAQSRGSESFPSHEVKVTGAEVGDDGRVLMIVAPESSCAVAFAALEDLSRAGTDLGTDLVCASNQHNCPNGTVVTNAVDCSDCGGGSAGACGTCCNALSPSPNANLNCRNMC